MNPATTALAHAAALISNRRDYVVEVNGERSPLPLSHAEATAAAERLRTYGDRVVILPAWARP